MNKDMLVEVYVSFATEKGKIATGYPVAPNKILTARHTLYSKEGAEPVKIEARWHYLKDKEDSYNWRTAKIIECGLGVELDVALLECEFPKDINYQWYLKPGNPKKELKWESEGFARAGKRDDKRSPTPLSGETYSAADNADWLVLTEKGKASEEKMWAGISGAPVFIRETNIIIGIVVQCPPHHDAARLHARPTWRLLKCKAFREVIEYDIRIERRDQVCQEIVNRLLQTKEICTALRKEAEASYHLSLEYQTERDIAKTLALAEFIIELPVVRLLELFDAVITGFLPQKKGAVAHATRQLVYYLLPFVFDQRIIKSINSRSKFGICTVPVATTTVAEIIMAGVDNRAVEYVFQENLHEELCGENNIKSQIEHSPNLGICADSDHVNAATDHLINAYCGIKELTKRDKMGRERLIKRAAGELQRLSDYLSKTLYCIYELPEEPSDREHCIQLLKGLKENFPSLVLMEISSAEANEDEEYETYFLLRKIHTTVIEGE